LSLLPVAAEGSVIDNESHCHTCGSDCHATLLLCCEACPFVFHTFCLKPPLSEVPPGAWYCPVCQAAEALVDEAGGLDRILAVRQSTPAPAAAAAAAADADAGGVDQQQQQQQEEEKKKEEGEGPNEFFVKWKDRSYLHCCWIPNETMQRAAAAKFVGVANPVATRLRKFWRAQAEAASNGVLREAEERGQLVHGINPEWTKVGSLGAWARFGVWPALWCPYCAHGSSQHSSRFAVQPAKSKNTQADLTG
jgi:hypothetical protein